MILHDLTDEAQLAAGSALDLSTGPMSIRARVTSQSRAGLGKRDRIVGCSHLAGGKSDDDHGEELGG